MWKSQRVDLEGNKVWTVKKDQRKNKTKQTNKKTRQTQEKKKKKQIKKQINILT